MDQYFGTGLYFPSTPIPAKGWVLLQYFLGDISKNQSVMDVKHQILKQLIGPIRYNRLLKDVCIFCGEDPCLCIENKKFEVKIIIKRG